MANVIETAKAGITAYNDKDWSKAKDILAADAVYDEKGTHRRIKGVGEIIDAWQGWAKAFPDSKATFVREFASGDTAVLELVWKGVHTGPLQTPTGTIPASNKPIDMPACRSPAQPCAAGDRSCNHCRRYKPLGRRHRAERNEVVGDGSPSNLDGK